MDVEEDRRKGVADCTIDELEKYLDEVIGDRES